MAKIVTGDQRIVTGATHPKAVYSRVVSCWATCPGGGARNYAFTPTLAKEIWLLGVDLWGQICLPTLTPHWFVTFRMSFAHPKSIDEARTCEIPKSLYLCGTGGHWPSRCSDYHWHWDLQVHYGGIGRWFGFDVVNMSADIGDFAASFEISEG